MEGPLFHSHSTPKFQIMFLLLVLNCMIFIYFLHRISPYLYYFILHAFLFSLWTDSALQFCHTRKCFFLLTQPTVKAPLSSLLGAVSLSVYLPHLVTEVQHSKTANTFLKVQTGSLYYTIYGSRTHYSLGKQYCILHTPVPIILVSFLCTACFNAFLSGLF